MKEIVNHVAHIDLRLTKVSLWQNSDLLIIKMHFLLK